MLARKQVARGFTLVEILIVVVILGILAAIVIPQFTSASESAKSSSLVSQLQTIRSQVELYQIQHNGDYPTLLALQADTDGLVGHDWAPLTTETEVDGSAGVPGDGIDSNNFGPYLQQPPTNSFELSADVQAIGGAAAGVGWVYDENTGEVLAVMPAAKATELNMDTTNNVETY